MVIEPKPPIAAKPDSAPVPTPAPSSPPKVKAVEVAKPGGALVNASLNIPVAKPLVQPSISSPPAEAGQGSRPPTEKPAPPVASKPSVAPPPDEPLTKPTRTATPAVGRAVELSLPTKPLVPAPATDPLRTTISPAAAAPAKPSSGGPMLGLVGVEPRPRAGDSRPLALPSVGGGSTNRAEVPPLALQVGVGTNRPPTTNDALRAIGVDPLLQGTAWREQQLARQAAEQKAREEEQRKLKGALYRFLFKGGTNSN
jgi:hypothetical protein